MTDKQSWDPKVRPDTSRCPGKFCMFWAAPGARVDLSRQTYDSLEDALAAAKSGTLYEDGGCACFLGPCLRDDPAAATTDLYESHEPHLKKAGLPWYYFYAKGTLAPEFQERLELEAADWWLDD